jgi:lipopolysaccharide export system permease protein
VHSLSATAATTFLQNGIFLEVDGYTFMAEKIDRDRAVFSDVFIYEPGESGGSRVITAREGRIVPTSVPGESILQLAAGETMRIRSRPPSQRSPSPGDFDAVTFAKLELPINLGSVLPFRARGIDQRELTLVELWTQRATPPVDVTRAEMLAEFNDRLVKTLSVFFLPFLAIGFAIAPPRTHRAYNMGIGVLILIIYNEIVRVGKVSAGDGLAPAGLTQWAPFLVFALFSTYLFSRQAFGVAKTSSLDRLITKLEDKRQLLWARLSLARR